MPNQQRQSTEGKATISMLKMKLSITLALSQTQKAEVT